MIKLINHVTNVLEQTRIETEQNKDLEAKEKFKLLISITNVETKILQAGILYYESDTLLLENIKNNNIKEMDLKNSIYYNMFTSIIKALQNEANDNDIEQIIRRYINTPTILAKLKVENKIINYIYLNEYEKIMNDFLNLLSHNEINQIFFWMEQNFDKLMSKIELELLLATPENFVEAMESYSDFCRDSIKEETEELSNKSKSLKRYKEN